MIDLYDSYDSTYKRFLWYNLYDSQSAFKFLWRLHIMQVVFTKFIKVVLTDYLAFKSWSKMI